MQRDITPFTKVDVDIVNRHRAAADLGHHPGFAVLVEELKVHEEELRRRVFEEMDSVRLVREVDNWRICQLMIDTISNFPGWAENQLDNIGVSIEGGRGMIAESIDAFSKTAPYATVFSSIE